MFFHVLMSTGSVAFMNRERGELLDKKKEEQNQAIAVPSCPCGINQKLNQLAHSLVTSKPGLDSEPAISLLVFMSCKCYFER